MKTVKVKVLKAHDYDQKPREIGEEYDCNEVFVNALKWTGNIEVIEEPKKKREYQRRDMQAEK